MAQEQLNQRAQAITWTRMVRLAPGTEETNAVGALLRHAQDGRCKDRYRGQLPLFNTVTRREGNRHSAPCFQTSVDLDGWVGIGVAYTKKEAKQRAAAAWLTKRHIYWPYFHPRRPPAEEPRQGPARYAQ